MEAHLLQERLDCDSGHLAALRSFLVDESRRQRDEDQRRSVDIERLLREGQEESLKHLQGRSATVVVAFELQLAEEELKMA